MKRNCPKCDLKSEPGGAGPKVVGHGRFYRRSDSKWVRRFRCLKCGKYFSNSCFGLEYRHKKRWANEWVRRLLCSGVSQRRAARLLKIHRTTVVRKLLYLEQKALEAFAREFSGFASIEIIEFDDMETFEHTKCKPLSVTIAVESVSRKILGLEVSSMPCKGRLAWISRKKYGPRADGRAEARKRLFERLKPLIRSNALIKSDENPHYKPDVKRHFPQCFHQTFKSRRACVVGQGELKKIGFDPLFSLNHTYAKIRADVNRLFRKTWCTTKRPDRLQAHLIVYAHYHNQTLSA